MSERMCLCCKRTFFAWGPLASVPDICRECWNFAYATFVRFTAWANPGYPVKGGCAQGTCELCDPTDFTVPETPHGNDPMPPKIRRCHCGDPLPADAQDIYCSEICRLAGDT